MLYGVLVGLLLLQTAAERASKLLDIGIEFSNRGQFPQAAEKFAEAVALDPSLAEAHYLIGLIRQQGGDKVSALKSFRTALRIHPGYAQAQARVCEIEAEAALARETGYPAALASCRRAIALDPRDPETQFHTGSIQSKLGQPASAIQYFSAALRLDPKFPNAKYELAMAYIESQNAVRGIALMKEVVAAQPDHGNARFQLGSALAKSGNCAEALPHLEAATEAPQKYYLLSTCYKKLNRNADADAALARVRQLREGADARTQAKFRAAVAQQKAEAGQLDEAVSGFRAAYELTHDPSLAIDLAVVLLRQGKPAEVLKLLDGHTDPLARYQVALAYGMQKKYVEARGALEEALRSNPRFAEAWYQLGITLLELNDAAAGEMALRKAVDLRPGDAAVRLGWASALERNGRAAEAGSQRALAALLSK